MSLGSWGRKTKGRGSGQGAMVDWLGAAAEHLRERLLPIAGGLFSLATQWFVNGVFLAFGLSVVSSIVTTDRSADSLLAKSMGRARRLATTFAIAMGIVVIGGLGLAALAPDAPTDIDVFTAALAGATDCSSIITHADDVSMELACNVDGVDEAHVYQFNSVTALSAWYETLTRPLSTGDCSTGSDTRGLWSADGGPSEWVACYSSDRGVTVLRAMSDQAIGVTVTRHDGNLATTLAAVNAVAIRLPAPRNPSGPCESGPVVWNDNGQGHDRWPDGRLDLELSPCTTVMISSGSMLVGNGDRCAGGVDSVCVLVWSATTRRAFSVDGLWQGATWWGYTNASAEDAIKDKSSLFNPRGWFGSANCSGRAGCAKAQVWVQSDDFFAATVVQHP